MHLMMKMIVFAVAPPNASLSGDHYQVVKPFASKGLDGRMCKLYTLVFILITVIIHIFRSAQKIQFEKLLHRFILYLPALLAPVNYDFIRPSRAR